MPVNVCVQKNKKSTVSNDELTVVALACVERDRRAKLAAFPAFDFLSKLHIGRTVTWVMRELRDARVPDVASVASQFRSPFFTTRPADKLDFAEWLRGLCVAHTPHQCAYIIYQKNVKKRRQCPTIKTQLVCGSYFCAKHASKQPGYVAPLDAKASQGGHGRQAPGPVSHGGHNLHYARVSGHGPVSRSPIHKDNLARRRAQFMAKRNG